MSKRAIAELMKQANRAIKEAVRKTLLEHKRVGVPIAIWKNNRVVRIPAHRIPTH